MTAPAVAASIHGAKRVWTTLISNRAYFPGVLVLHHSLVRSGSRYPLVVVVPPAVGDDDPEFMAAFAAAGIAVRVVPPIEPDTLDPERVEKYNFFQKFSPWGLVEFERVALLDSDQIILQNIDELLERDLPKGHILSTHACTCNPMKRPHYPKTWVPENCGWTHATPTTGCYAGNTPPADGSPPRNAHLLNSGTVVLRPSQSEYDALLAAMNSEPTVPSMVFPDQDLLAIVYAGKWEPLPYWYNALKPMRWCHAPLWRDEDVKILHYILAKPWKSRTWDEGDTVLQTHRLWWDEWAMVEREWEAEMAAAAEKGPGGEKEKDSKKTRELWEAIVVPNIAQK